MGQTTHFQGGSALQPLGRWLLAYDEDRHASRSTAKPTACESFARRLSSR
jgi:hypothetical protein